MSLPESRLSGILTDRYRIERELGQGGMATVYLAHDLKHEREVALKVLRPELGAVLGSERFLAEIKITARLDHPHILTLIDSGTADGLLYYVLPFVRGESLRDLLNRERQLGLDMALAITKQVGSALEYAHRKGVVHRDIKPENILLQEGEAMLADFGIALAVKEAGGNRLTETGLSLGTPSYMSPEQATGDRTLDARSDVYSLAAVLYEMLAGQPPVTGATVQAVIAKLLTEQPGRIRTVRSSVPEGVDDAVAKALSKVPADRFASAAEFVNALGQARTTAAMPAATAPRASRTTRIAIGGGLVAVAALAAFGLSRKGAPREAAVALRDRTQLTFTGAVSIPALSADGKQLAYFVKVCDKGGDCTYAIDVQDVGNPTSRRILEGMTSAYGLEWSPDRRNLLTLGTVGGRYGTHLVSALGGTPRLLTAGSATFFAGGDSLLMGSPGPDSVFTVRVASLNGAVRDSIRIPGPGTSLASLSVMPGTSRIIALVIQAPRGLWQIVDRTGKVTDRLLNTCTCGAAASHDAIWMTRAGPTAAEAVVRVAIDPATGKFASRQDTVYSGQFSGLSVTADGTQMAVDDGTYAFTVLAVDVPDLIRGKLPEGAPLMQASSNVGAAISPDGNRLLLRRVLPGAAGQRDVRLAIVPFGGGAETPVNISGQVTTSSWVDSVTIAAGTYTSGGLRLALVDVRSGATRNPLELPDSTIGASTPLSQGWAWIPRTGDRIIVQDGAERREIVKPGWFSSLNGLNAAPDGGRLMYQGWGATDDTVRFDVVPVRGGPAVPWFSSFAEGATGRWMNDGSLLVTIWSAEQRASLFKVRGPGQVQPVGRIPHPVNNLTISSNLARATIGWREYKGDAWLYRVVKP